MADEWVGIIKAGMPRYIKGAEDLTIRERLELAMMEARGNIILNCDSYEQTYDVDWKDAPVEDYADGGVVNYQRRDYLKQATLDWRGYVSTDHMTVKEKAEMKGDVVIVDRYNRIIPKLVQGVRNHFGTEFYIDGNAAGNENKFCGAGTWAGESSNTAEGDLVIAPDDTYNGLDTDCNQDGRWSAVGTAPNAELATDWPEGEGSPEYDYWSPKLVNWVGDSWPNGDTQTWYAACLYVIRRTAQWLWLTSGQQKSTLMCFLTGSMLTDMKNQLYTVQRVITPHKESEDLGFPDVLNFEGVGCQAGFGIDANTAWMLNMDKVEMCILEEELIKTEGPDWDPDSLGWKFSARSFGNFKWVSPKYHAKLYNYDDTA